MRTSKAKFLALILALASLIGTATAQLTSLPVSFSPKQNSLLNTLVIRGDFGFFNHDVGDFKGFAGSAVWNPGRFSLMGGVGALLSNDHQAQDGLTAGAALGYDLKPPTSFPWKPIIQLKGAIGYTKISEVKQWNIPVALGLAVILPPPQSNITLWAAPRLHFRSGDTLEPLGGAEIDDIGFGISAGLALTSIYGPGLHVELEWLRIDGQSEYLISAGLHWNFILSY
jgi:hypothetical protein